MPPKRKAPATKKKKTTRFTHKKKKAAKPDHMKFAPRKRQTANTFKKLGPDRLPPASRPVEPERAMKLMMPVPQGVGTMMPFRPRPKRPSIREQQQQAEEQKFWDDMDEDRERDRELAEALEAIAAERTQARQPSGSRNSPIDLDSMFEAIRRKKKRRYR
jgi:hypothetical protein